MFFRRRLLCACGFFPIFLFHKGQLTLNGAACILRVKMREKMRENAEKLHRISSTIYVGRQAPFQACRGNPLYTQGWSKEVIKEQTPARNLPAAVRKVLQSTNVLKQRPLFWSKI